MGSSSVGGGGTGRDGKGRHASEGAGDSAPVLASCFANESMFSTINQKRHARAAIIPLKASGETGESGPRFSAPGATDLRGLILETCQGKQGHGKRCIEDTLGYLPLFLPHQSKFPFGVALWLPGETSNDGFSSPRRRWEGVRAVGVVVGGGRSRSYNRQLGGARLNPQDV